MNQNDVFDLLVIMSNVWVMMSNEHIFTTITQISNAND